MKISPKAIERAKKAIRAKCGKLPKRDQRTCQEAAVRVGRTLAKELHTCNRLKGRKRRACHAGRMAAMKAIASPKK